MVQAGPLLMWFSLTKNLLYNSHTICATQRIADSIKIPRLFSVFKKLFRSFQLHMSVLYWTDQRTLDPRVSWKLDFLEGSKVISRLLHCELDWWFWYENCFQCLCIESRSMASDSEIGTPILALKNHEMPKKVIKANVGQRRPKKSKIPKSCNFINIQ